MIPSRRLPTKAIAAIVAGYALFGLVILVPQAVYSGDIGVKFVQARALFSNQFRSLDIPYPGAFLDPDEDFFPIRTPFVMKIGGMTQTIFSPMSSLLQAAMAGIAGLRGMVLASILAAAVVLIATARMAPADLQLPAVLALGVGSPLWFYAVTGWEHAPAIALSTAGFALAMCSDRRGWPVMAAMLVAAGATLRDEVILLLPGLAYVVWHRTREVRAVLLAIAGATVPLALGAIIEVFWFGRPLAAHLRHAVHLLQSAAHTTADPNPEVPSLVPLTIRERYETVVWYWLLGYGRDRWILAYLGGLAAAVIARWRLRTSVPLLLWTVAVVGLAAIDTWEVVTAPRFLAGLHRVSPYLVFAVLPFPLVAPRRHWLNGAVATTVGAYLVIAFVGVDTTGGKSLGPRLLMPLFPLLTVASMTTITAYLRSGAAMDRRIGWAGVTLVTLAMATHLLGTPRAYLERNRIDARPIIAAMQSNIRILVADEEFTAQLLLPLYYRKIVFLADTPEQGSRLAANLIDGKIAEVLLISRDPTPATELRPLRLQRVTRSGRFTIQHWSR